MQKKDKEKVFGGDWTEEQFREFMLVESYDGQKPLRNLLPSLKRKAIT